MRMCPICDKPIKSYDGKTRLKCCNACNTRIRRYLCKQAAIKLLGGKCNRCGFAGHQSAFEFHHKDSSAKEFAIGNVANKSWQTIKKELMKCELLCSNCHRIEHQNRDCAKFLEAVQNYKSKVYSTVR